MCEGFGLIVSKDLKVYFVEPNKEGDCSHSDILSRLGWKDNEDKFNRNFVRVEYADWKANSFRFDEENTLPGWAENNRDDIRTTCDGRLSLCAPALAEYNKVRAPALAEYEKVCAPAWAEYKKVRDAAWAEYKKVRDAAWDEYNKVRDAAWDEYEKVRAPAWAEYNKVCDAALDELITALSKIEGYVPA